MKRIFYLLIPFIFLATSSCQEEDPNPFQAEIQGTWESRVLNTYFNMDFVTQFVFMSDGTITQRISIHEKDQIPVKYLLYEGKGRFNTNGKVVTVDRFNYKYAPTGNVPPDPLVDGEKDSGFEISYELVLGGTQMIFPRSCSGDTCTQEQTFTKLN